MALSARILFVGLVFLSLLFLYGCPGSGSEAQPPPAQPNPQAAAPAAPPANPPQAPPKQVAKCGNGFLETGEECEGGVGCPEGKVCNDAKCKCGTPKVEESPPAAPVCGNGAVETGEACEQDADCGNASMICSSCACTPKPVQQLQEAACGNGNLETGEECDVGTAAKPANNACPAGEYCSSCKCYTAAEPISCLSNHKYAIATGINQFIQTPFLACGDDCAVYGVDAKCDLQKCVCVIKSVTSHTCGNNFKESVEECDGTDSSWCRSDQTCGIDCTCVATGGG